MIEVVSCLFENKAICDQIFEIRKVVFVEEQQVNRDEEFDEFETQSIHFLAKWEGIPCGSARWRITSKGIKLERFAVLREFRKKGVAAAVLNRVLRDVKPANVRIYLNAQVTAMGLYEKFGFVTEGPLFVEAGIDHYKMVYQP